MCGLAGLIGESKKPNLSYDLITKLFDKSEIRGIDASGFWATEIGNAGKVLYHKEPVKSSDFVKKDVWKQIAKHQIDLLLVHARGASRGFGDPNCNINNHPFTSSDKSLALIHNGKIEDYEYKSLRQKYEVKSECDSEIILRILENQTDNKSEFKDYEYPNRIAGIKEIFSLINDGHMAVAAGERLIDGSRLLWIFRNKYRPLWVIDLRELLGQVFFISEPNIWDEALSEINNKQLIKSQKLIEIPHEEIWFFKITEQNRHPLKVQRFEVSKSEDLEPWTYDGVYNQIQDKSEAFEIVSSLTETDEIIGKKKTYTPEIFYEDSYIKDLDNKCDLLKERIDSIQITVQQLNQEQSMSRMDFEQLLEMLDQQKKQLDEIEHLLR